MSTHRIWIVVLTLLWCPQLVAWDREAMRQPEATRLGEPPKFEGEKLIHSPDKSLFATVYLGRFVRVYDGRSGRLLHELDGNMVHVRAIAFSPDGRTLATGGDLVCLWDASAGLLLRVIDTGTHTTQSLAFSGDGKTVFSSGDIRGRKLALIDRWEVTSGRKIQTLVSTNYEVQQLVVSPDGKWLASLCHGNAHGDGADDVQLWDIATGKRRLAGSEFRLAHLAFTPDSRLLAMAALDPRRNQWEVRLVDVATQTVKLAFPGSGPLAFSPDGRLLAYSQFATPGKKFQISVWDVDGGKRVLCRGEFSSEINSLWFSADGKTLLIKRGRVWEVDLSDGTLRPPPAGHDWTIQSLDFSPDGKLLAAASCDGVRIWDMDRRRVVRVLKQNPHNRYLVPLVKFSPSGEQLAFFSREHGLRLYRFGNDSVRQLAKRQKPCALTWRNDRLLAMYSFRGNFELIDCLTEQQQWCLHVEKSPWRTQFTSGGKQLAVSSGSWIEIHDTDTGKRLKRFELADPTHRVKAMLVPGGMICLHRDTTTSWFPNQRMRPVEVLIGQRIELWDFAAGRLQRELREEFQPNRYKIYSEYGGSAVSPRGRVLAVATAIDPQTVGLLRPRRCVPCVRLTETVSGSEIVRLDHPGPGIGADFGSLCFSPDGKRLAAAVETSVLLWDVGGWTGQGEVDAGSLTDEELQLAWRQMAKPNAAAARQAMNELRSGGGQTVAFVARQVPVSRHADRGEVSRWLLSIDDERFDVRQRAQFVLQNFADTIQDDLKAALEEPHSAERRFRVKAILRHFAAREAFVLADGDALRVYRAVQLLEEMATPQARALLQQLARGAQSRRTREAAWALEKLGKK